MKAALFIIIIIMMLSSLGSCSDDSCNKAIDLLNSKPKADSDFAASLLDGCDCLKIQKDYTNAKSCYKMVNDSCELILEEDESNIDAVVLRTNVVKGLIDLGNKIGPPAGYDASPCNDVSDFSFIISQYDKAIEMDPHNADVWNDRGALLGEVCSFNESLASFEEAIRSNSSMAEAWYNKGVLLYRGNPSEALRCFNRSVELNPNLPEAWFNRYALLMPDRIDMSNPSIKKAYEEAKRCKDYAIRLNPDFANKKPPYLIFARIGG